MLSVWTFPNNSYHLLKIKFKILILISTLILSAKMGATLGLGFLYSHVVDNVAPVTMPT